jgi:formylmethanofuran dehydrogenase subunit E
MENPSVCGVALQDYLIEMEEFHGGRSPGMPGHGILFRDTGE